jgi:UDP-N-acetylglucosamine/UDP-N-acetylgalactosamine diphosphorylase
MTVSPQHAAIHRQLQAVGQGHLLAFAEQLSPGQQQALLSQIASLDLDSLPALSEQYVLRKPEYRVPATLAPAIVHAAGGRIVGLPASSAQPATWDRAAAQRAGEAIIRAGKLAAFVVAGGQGSRLGFEGPKGCFLAGALSGKSLFQLFAENLLGAKDRFGVEVPWYIMTSPLNDAQTRQFFEAHSFFGLSKSSVRFLQQGVSPSFDITTGKVLLASKGEVATNPDGHGGAVRALHTSGALQDMQARGIEHISYFQVDNPHARIVDPVFLGLHATPGAHSSGQMSSKVVPKVGPEEKVGVFVLADGRSGVLEYSDMPKALQEAREPDGTLRFGAGNIAIHLLSRAFVQRLATDSSFALPWHRAEKKIPCIDPRTGEPISPSTNNGVKLEKFIFDALALCDKSLVLETDRIEEFAPIKNASGSDSPESCKQLQTQRAARWLAAQGVHVPTKPDGSPDCIIEVSPRTATSADELRAASVPRTIERGARVSL